MRLERRNLPDSTELLRPFGWVDDNSDDQSPGAGSLAVEREVEQDFANDLRGRLDEQQLAGHDDVVET